MLILLPALVVIRSAMNWRWFVALASTAGIPFVWFEVLSNHTQIHPFTTYRPIASCIGILIAAALMASGVSKGQPAGERSPLSG